MYPVTGLSHRQFASPLAGEIRAANAAKESRPSVMQCRKAIPPHTSRLLLNYHTDRQLQPNLHRVGRGRSASCPETVVIHFA